MKVEMKKNLGSRDARALEIKDHLKCTEGEVVEVSDDAAEFLVSRKWASLVKDEQPVKAVPSEPVKAKPAETAKAVTETPKAKK